MACTEARTCSSAAHTRTHMAVFWKRVPVAMHSRAWRAGRSADIERGRSGSLQIFHTDLDSITHFERGVERSCTTRSAYSLARWRNHKLIVTMYSVQAKGTTSCHARCAGLRRAHLQQHVASVSPARVRACLALTCVATVADLPSTSALTGTQLQVAPRAVSTKAVSTYSRPPAQLRLIQHKQEAYWFYRFLSIVYDHIVNPGHWTKDMRDDALAPANLDSADLKVRLDTL